jgi:hypothetical protein
MQKYGMKKFSPRIAGFLDFVYHVVFHKNTATIFQETGSVFILR